MPITVMWDSPKRTAIRFLIEERWTWDDLKTSMYEASVLLDTIENRQVHALVDMQHAHGFPMGMLLHNARNLARDPHPRWGRLVVMVGASTLVELFVEKLCSIYPNIVRAEFVFTDSMEDARQRIALQVQHAAERVPTGTDV